MDITIKFSAGYVNNCQPTKTSKESSGLNEATTNLPQDSIDFYSSSKPSKFPLELIPGIPYSPPTHPHI